MSLAMMTRAPVYPEPTSEPISVRWSGSPWNLVGLSIVNFFLTVVTLGIYSFWGKTEVRRRMWSSIRLQGEPLVYTGTGGELFKGFCLILLVVFLPILLLGFVAAIVLGPGTWAQQVISFGFSIATFLLMGIAVYRARRYRLTRTVWRGIRGGMSGSSVQFAMLWVWTSLLIPLTLGWIIPWRANRLQRALGRETTFGNRQFTFEGSSGPLYLPFSIMYGAFFVVGLAMMGAIGLGLIAASATPDVTNQFSGAIASVIGFVVLTVLVLPIVFAWYRSRTYNLMAAYTGFEGARFRLRTTAPGLIGLVLSNFAIVVMSVGILRPVAQARTAKYLIDRLTIDGLVDVTAILQSNAELGRGGEGLAQMFDVDAF